MLNRNETKTAKRSKVLQMLGTFGLISLLGIGIFGQLGWLPNTDTKTGERNGWFGVKIEKASNSSNWNPFPEPAPIVAPALAKEYIYAGDRMLAIEDYAQPTPTITPTPTPGSGGGSTPTPTPTATPTPTPAPTQCSSPWTQVKMCEEGGQMWDYVTCTCGVE